MKHAAEVSLTPRNGTVDFLLYPQGADSKGIEVRVQDGMVWLNQAGMAELYQIDRSIITKHIRHIYQNKEQLKTRLVQNLHKLPITGKPINIYSIPWIAEALTRNQQSSLLFFLLIQ